MENVRIEYHLKSFLEIFKLSPVLPHSPVLQKVSTKPLLRPGWRQVFVQSSINSCGCEQYTDN